MDGIEIDMSLKRSFRQQIETLFREEIVFAPASLDISVDEWKNIVYVDVELAAQIGCMLLERNKDLNMIITSADECAEEQALKIQYYERQIRTLKESFESQTKLYDKFEEQLQELTTNYEKIQRECQHYKKKNKKLWKSIEYLEQTCDTYLEEINQLKSRQRYDNGNLRNSNSTESSTDFSIEHVHSKNSSLDAIENNSAEYSDLISLRAFSEELSRKFDVEKNQRKDLERKYEKMKRENEDLYSQIQWLEYKLVRDEPCSLPKPVINLSKSKSLFDVSALDDDDTTSNDNDVKQHQNNLAVPFITHVSDFDKDLLNNKLMTSSPVKETNNDDVFCSYCAEIKARKNKEATSNIRKNSSLSNYQHLFDEIFEKLKTTRDT